MSSEQLLVISFGVLLVGGVFLPPLSPVPLLSLPSASTSTKKLKKDLISSDQRILRFVLRWVGVLVVVLIAACSLFFLEILKLNYAA